MERKTTLKNRILRKARVRSRVSGTSARPRLTVTISNRHVKAQLVDDDNHKTLLSSSTVGKKDNSKSSKTELAEWVGADIAKKAKKAKITKVVFDRNSRLYHGRIAALAEAARKEGLEF